MKEGVEPRAGLAGMEVVLHDLCQPLTVLQCKLEIGLLRGTHEATRQAITDGLRECTRLSTAVQAMRDVVREMKADDASRARLGGGN